MKTIFIKLNKVGASGDAGAQPVWINVRHIVQFFSVAITTGDNATYGTGISFSTGGTVVSYYETVDQVRDKLREMDCGVVLVEGVAPDSVTPATIK
jgi:hypothetical protein